MISQKYNVAYLIYSPTESRKHPTGHNTMPPTSTVQLFSHHGMHYSSSLTQFGHQGYTLLKFDNILTAEDLLD